VSNKAGHGKKGTIIAIVRGTKAEEKFKEWYKSVAQSTLREVKAARDLIMSREDEVLNYFSNRPTNAAAESLNAKMKGFRSQLRGYKRFSFLHVSFGGTFGLGVPQGYATDPTFTLTHVIHYFDHPSHSMPKCRGPKFKKVGKCLAVSK